MHSSYLLFTDEGLVQAVVVAATDAMDRSGRDAATALRCWIIDNFSEGKVTIKQVVKSFFKAVPWAAPFVKAQPPSEFCKTHASLLRFDAQGLIEAAPSMVDGHGGVDDRGGGGGSGSTGGR